GGRVGGGGWVGPPPVLRVSPVAPRSHCQGLGSGYRARRWRTGPGRSGLRLGGGSRGGHQCGAGRIVRRRARKRRTCRCLRWWPVRWRWSPTVTRRPGCACWMAACCGGGGGRGGGGGGGRGGGRGGGCVWGGSPAAAPPRA